MDARHAFARLPGDLALSAGLSRAVVPVRLRDRKGALLPGRASLTVVHDTGFPDPTALVAARSGRLFALSTPTDELWAIDPEGGAVQRIPMGDGPSALATYVDALGHEWVAVAHRFSPELWILSATEPAAAPRKLAAVAGASGLALAEGVAYVAERTRSTVVALDLATGRSLWRVAVPPHPGPLAVAGPLLAVGCQGSGEVALLDRRDGAARGSVAPGPGASIVDGTTAAFSAYVMGGKAPRALAYSPALGRLFEASIGPNIGPNPQRMEVSMNGGVASLDPTRARFDRHLGFGAGVTQALALDDRAGILYAADVALGQIRILDARRLAQDDRSAAHALLQTVAVPPPAGFPTARPVEDYGIHGRAGVELHSGPQALALAPDRKSLYVLDRFTGTIARLDVRRRGRARLVSQLPLVPTLGERERRQGEILYFTDLGRTGMSCDACHLEGGAEGILYSKSHPLRIYRSPTLLGSAETPPYFNPLSSHTLEETARFVGDRNRYHNPDLAPGELRALVAYTALLAFPPNPFVGVDGAPPERLELPDGKVGRPRLGMALFEGKAACESCHPSPEFTTDASPATRGRYQDVGTPAIFPLRVAWQDRAPSDFEPPSLLGAWAAFPLLSSGTGGLGERGGRAVVTTRFPLRELLEAEVPHPHGRSAGLTPAERDDLLAYLMTL